jgi:hypothetical protein
MMNTLGRRAQAQSDTQVQAQATGQEGEALPKEKVKICHNLSSFLFHFGFVKEPVSSYIPINTLGVFPYVACFRMDIIIIDDTFK